jgi:hypothetical protein
VNEPAKQYLRYVGLLMDSTPVTYDRRDGNDVAEVRARFFHTGKCQGHPYKNLKPEIKAGFEILFDEIDRLRCKYEPARPMM